MTYDTPAAPDFCKKRKTPLTHKDPVFFLDHHHGPPASCSLSQGKPDLLAVYGSKESFEAYQKRDDEGRVYYSGVPCYELISTAECKPGTKPGSTQAMRYTEQLLEARPDMIGVYGLSANARTYAIVWSDASGPVSSPPIEWSNFGPLERYVYSLYVPRKGMHTQDPTITSPTLRVPTIQTEGKKKGLHWSIEYGGKKYEECHQFHTAEGFGRRTTVYMYNNPGNPKDFAVIKDAYRDDRRRFKEADLLKHIHEEGIFPGVVRPLASGEVNGLDGSPIGTASAAASGIIYRSKQRVVMGSRGSKLDAAESVKDILMAIYDGVEGAYSLKVIWGLTLSLL